MPPCLLVPDLRAGRRAAGRAAALLSPAEAASTTANVVPGRESRDEEGSRSMRTGLLLALAVLLQATGNTCLSRGMKQLGASLRFDPAGALDGIARALPNPWIWLGILCLLGFVVVFSILLSASDLSFVLPALSIEVVVNVAFAAWFLGEAVSPRDWLGAGLVTAGVALVATSARPEAAP